MVNRKDCILLIFPKVNPKKPLGTGLDFVDKRSLTGQGRFSEFKVPFFFTTQPNFGGKEPWPCKTVICRQLQRVPTRGYSNPDAAGYRFLVKKKTELGT